MTDKEDDEVRAAIAALRPKPGEVLRCIPAAELDKLRAENERLRVDLDDVNHEHQAYHSTRSASPAVCSHEAENDQWQKKLAEVWAERERLRALIDKHNDQCRECPVIEAKTTECHGTDGTHISGCVGWEAMRDAEIERLRRDLQRDALHPLVNEALQQYQTEIERLQLELAQHQWVVES